MYPIFSSVYKVFQNQNRMSKNKKHTSIFDDPDLLWKLINKNKFHLLFELMQPGDAIRFKDEKEMDVINAIVSYKKKFPSKCFQIDEIKGAIAIRYLSPDEVKDNSNWRFII